MKNAVLSLIVLLSIATENLQAQAQDPAIAVTQEAIDNFFAFDMRAYADAFTTEGILVNPYGMTMKGQEVIYQAHLPVVARWEGLTGHAQTSNESVMHLSDDVALVNMEVSTWFTNPAGEKLNELPVILSSTIVKQDGQWRISCFQVTPVTGPPAQG